MKELLEKMDFILIERRKTTNVELTKAKRQLRIDKTRDINVELYDDLIKFMATYLNGMDFQELGKLKFITREKAETLIQDMASDIPEVQAVLDKMHLEPKKVVSRFWTLKDMKITIQDAVNILLKGAKASEVVTPKMEAKEEKHLCDQCGKDMGNEWILGPVCGKCVRKNHKEVVSGKKQAPKKKK